MTPVELFEPTEDRPIPGGCEVCDAFQVMERLGDGMWVMHVAHDEWCPVLKAMHAGANGWASQRA